MAKQTAVKVYKVNRETEKAVQMDDMWFPKSQVEVYQDDQHGTWAVMPDWLLNKNYGRRQYSPNFMAANVKDFGNNCKNAKRIV